VTNRSGMKDVVGISSLNVDYIYETADLSFLQPFYPEGKNRRAWLLTDSDEIQKIKIILKEKARLISKSGGGSAANTVYCLAKMGFQSGIVGKIGRDDDADFLIREMRTIPFHSLARNQWTGTAFIVLGSSRDRTILLLPNANQTLVWADLDLDFIGSFSMMHLTSLPGEGLKLQARLAGELSGRMRISLDPGEIYVRQGLIALTSLLSRCEILFITEAELQILTGLPMLDAIAAIQSTGIEIIVIKKKAAGAYIVQGAETWDLPAEIIQAKDTTGAGDVFAAGFLAGLLKGQSLPDCGRLGLAMAHQSMMGLGREAYPGEEDFQKAFKKIGNSSRD
jgi:ribokinase